MRSPVIIAACALAVAVLAGCDPAEDASSADAGQAKGSQQTGGAPQGGDKPQPVPAGTKMCDLAPQAEVEKAFGSKATLFTSDDGRCLYSIAKGINLDIVARPGFENEVTKELKSLPDVSPGATLVVDYLGSPGVLIPLTDGGILVTAEHASPDKDEDTQALIKIATLFAKNLSG